MSSPAAPNRPTLSVAIITLNEEANLPRTLESVKWADEIVVVDSGSTDKTCDIARSFGAKVFVEPWKGFAAQKNSALDKCTSDWILSLDADEEVSPELRNEITEWLVGTIVVPGGKKGYEEKLSEQLTELYNQGELKSSGNNKTSILEVRWCGLRIPRKNMFMGRWIKYGGYYPDMKLRLIRKNSGQWESRSVHEVINLRPVVNEVVLHHLDLPSPLYHHAYPTLSGYIEHMNRYSSLGAEMATEKGPRGFSIINIVLRPIATFIYNYFFRLGFLDGREGLLLHLYHSVYVSWKYAKAWERSRQQPSSSRQH